jgi:predicted nucleotidyltransferase
MDPEPYVDGWRRRIERERRSLAEEAARARGAAHEAARRLVRELGATEVWLFGSLARGPRHADFDVDVAVRGVAADRWFGALSLVSGILERPVDLVALESCPASLARRVLEEGVRLDVE